MNTSKLCSTISYNTPEFLSGKLYHLVQQGILEYAHWIWHKAEEDEKKGHAHVVIKPNKRLNTGALQNEFKETVSGEDKPRGVLPFKSSKMQDWVLYSVHDEPYLLRKGLQTRKFTYQKSDLHTTEPDQLEEDWRDAHQGEDNRVKQVIELAKNGTPWRTVLEMGLIPVQHIYHFKEVFGTFYQEPPRTYRRGREGHDEI